MESGTGLGGKIPLPSSKESRQASRLKEVVLEMENRAAYDSRSATPRIALSLQRQDTGLLSFANTTLLR
jgi:hypothetical protein